MKLACILGYPLGHSMSPVMHRAGFAALDLDVRYEAREVPPDELPAAVEALRGEEVLGASVTIPHKQAIMSLVDEVDAAAVAIGSVNTIVNSEGRLYGHNTDKEGFLRSLREAGCDPAGLSVLIMGVGGAERAVAYGLAEAGAASITLAGRRPEQVALAARQLSETAPRPLAVRELAWSEPELTKAAREADLIVNCTPIGMRHSPQESESPLTPEALRSELWVVDIVYNPLETPLLRLARSAGAHTIDGLGMLVYQGVAQQVLWTGREPPADIMREAVAKLLTATE